MTGETTVQQHDPLPRRGAVEQLLPATQPRLQRPRRLAGDNCGDCRVCPCPPPGPGYRGDPVSYVMAVYLCHVMGGQPEADGSEVHELRYVSQPELAGLDLPSWAHIVLPAAFAAAAHPPGVGLD